MGTIVDDVMFCFLRNHRNFNIKLDETLNFHKLSCLVSILLMTQFMMCSTLRKWYSNEACHHLSQIPSLYQWTRFVCPEPRPGRSKIFFFWDNFASLNLFNSQLKSLAHLTRSTTGWEFDVCQMRNQRKSFIGRVFFWWLLPATNNHCKSSQWTRVSIS